MSPHKGEAAAQLADAWISGTVDDPEAAARLGEVSDVVTIDTEHVPATVLSYLELTRLVRPSSGVLRTIQDRKKQRRFLEGIGAPQPRCVPVNTLAALRESAASVGFPCVLKTRHAGYDGKGQTAIRSERELPMAWEKVGENPAMLEEFVPFESEVSVLLARRPSGEMRFFPLARNVHRQHILHSTVAPAAIASSLQDEARDIARSIAEELGHVGMMAVEMFIVDGSRLLVNEIAPRPHNSGHYTFGACVASQFEQHVRAILDVPLGDTSLCRAAATVNLLGNLWEAGEPDWNQILAFPEARLHLYGKAEPRRGRKMGHVLVLDTDPGRALHTGEAVLEQLGNKARRR